MTYFYKLQNSERELKELKQKVGRLVGSINHFQKNTDLFAKDILNPSGAIPEIEKLRGEARQLIRQLESQLKGGQKRYAPERKARKSAHFQGMYGNLKGHNRQLVKILNNLVVHLNLLIDLIKNSDNKQARITHTMAEALQQNMVQQKDYGTSFDGGDPIILVLAVVALFKRWRTKK